MNSEKEILRHFSIEIAWAINALSDVSTQAAKDVIPIVQKCNLLDQRVISKGLPSLTNMRDSDYRKLSQILYRGNIKNKSEYNILLSYLNDTSNTALSDNDVDKSNKLLMSFENKSEQNT
jgi:hypothetical protein